MTRPRTLNRIAGPRGRRGDSGQAALMVLAVAAALLTAAVVLFAFGNALGARGKYQRAADLAAISAAQVMRDAYPRLFEPPFLQPGMPNPRHLTRAAYEALARAAAARGVRSNGASETTPEVSFDASFAPTRVTVRVNAAAAGQGIQAQATAELVPEAGNTSAQGGGYSGPLAHRQGKPVRPDVALAFDRMATAAEREANLFLIVTSGFRSDAEQAILFAANPDPEWVAPPGESLHRYATELDLGPPAAYAWLAANAPRFGFVKRYPHEPWHFGYTRSPGSSSVGFGARGADGAATRAVQSFVPARFAPIIVRAAQRWGVSAHLLAAQLYAESGFNPFARSSAGAEGIAQFMPGTAEAMGLEDSFDAGQAIAAQARLMRELLGRFGSVPLALAAYNAGPGAVSGCGCVPPYPETRAYVAKVLGLLGGAGEPAGATLEVRLVA